MRNLLLTFAGAGFTLVVITRVAPAYGPIGHQIVGAIADERLANTPTAVARFAKEEPQHWRFGADVQLKDYGEACASFQMPIARAAHERLQFRNVRIEQKPEEEPLAAGTAEEKPGVDHVSYYDWSAAVVRDEMHVAGWRLADLLEKALQ